MSWSIVPVLPGNQRAIQQIDALLQQENIRRDANLDYTCAMYDEYGELTATGSCFGNTLRCIAVRSARQGEGLLNQLITHLIQVQYSRGNYHLFLYTKSQTAKFFKDLGFHEIARVEDNLTFLENRKNGFANYLDDLRSVRQGGMSAAIVMNANPFTVGHQYLVEQAAMENDTVHLFVVSEDASLFPFQVRKQLVQSGTAHLSNVICHDSGPYIISNATFPSYFFKDETAVIEGHARLDLAVFGQIAQALQITRRYVGEEPSSKVTSLYNQIMSQELPKFGISCVILPRKEQNGMAISASIVRRSIQTGDMTGLHGLLPPTTLAYLQSAAAEQVLAKIRASADVTHY